ncbi:MAG: tetratricopeptide repeat protein, partial [Verrucomicrobia bacterium]|nr:tetratricopeptide repeat protein [Verrucomicrobiota bacterium]
MEVQAASRHLERAHALRRQHLGARHPETLHTAHSLFWAYQNADRVSEAVALGEEVVRLRTEVLGREHPDTLHSLDKLAVSYYSAAGRVEDAVRIYEEVVRLN